MIEDSACQVTVAGYWAGLSWQVFHLLLQQPLALSVLAAIIATRWILPWRRLRRYISRTGMVLLVGYWVMSMPITASIGGRGLTALIPSDTGETADAIVILGRGAELRPSRVDVAAQLWQQGRSPLLPAVGEMPSRLAKCFTSKGFLTRQLMENPARRQLTKMLS